MWRGAVFQCTHLMKARALGWLGLDCHVTMLCWWLWFQRRWILQRSHLLRPGFVGLRDAWNRPGTSAAANQKNCDAYGREPCLRRVCRQHGDSMNWDYMNGLPVQTGTALKRAAQIGRNLAWRGPTTLSVCHSEPGAWHPAHYSTSVSHPWRLAAAAAACCLCSNTRCIVPRRA